MQKPEKTKRLRRAEAIAELAEGKQIIIHAGGLDKPGACGLRLNDGCETVAHAVAAIREWEACFGRAEFAAVV